jgi:hypothetical protein
MRELFFQLKKSGFSGTFRDGGIVIDLPKVSICLGADGDHFMSYVQEDFEYGPVFTASEGLTKAEAIELCQSYVKPVAIDRPELV